MSTEQCKLCNQESTPWVRVNGHVCQDCYWRTKRLFKLEPYQWTDVKDKLPDCGELVLVTDGIHVYIAFIQSMSKTFTQVNTWKDLHEDITHWMKLPEPPQMNED